MFGNLINNRQLKSLIDSKAIEIEPFISENLSTAHYTVSAGKVLKVLDNGKVTIVHDFFINQSPYVIEENEYVIIEAYEIIKLNDDNVVGHFVPASNLIIDGLSLTAGKIDKRYGNLGPSSGGKSEKIQFGLKNNLNKKVKLVKQQRIAHLELFDLRGVSSEKAELSDNEKLIIAQRFMRALEDGPTYPEE